MSQLTGAESAWIRFVPRPERGLPALFVATALAVAATLGFDLPPGLLALVAVPIPVTGIRWGRAPSYAGIGCIFVAAGTLSLLDTWEGDRNLQRITIQVGALALMWEVVHAAARAREAAAAALAGSEARYRQLVQTLNVMPFEYDLDEERFLYVGPQMERVLGYPAEVCLAPGFWNDHLHPEDRDGAVQFCMAAVERGEDHDFEYRMQTASGEVVWIHDIVSIVPGTAASSRLRGVMVDVTERHLAEAARRELEERVMESQKLESLGMLAGGVAHDFNNLLAAILGNASLALDELRSEHPAQPLIADLALAAERGSELTRQMLAYTGQASFESRTRNLSEIVQETARLLASSISKSARLELDLAGPIWVRADAGQMHQLVMNLVTNASDALEGGDGIIRVRPGVEATGDAAEPARAFVEVCDDGVGMEPETVRAMFDPFFTTKFKGRGLGLAVVHGIVRGHGGDIRVEAVPGKGTSIRVRLPGCPAPELQAEVPAVSGRDGDGRGRAILVVDDEPQVRGVARLALTAAGYEVFEAGDGLEALERARELPALAAVVLDMTMPRLSGGETLRALHELRPGLPVLLMSGYAEEEFADIAASGPCDFLAKPFRVGDLRERLSGLLAARVAVDQSRSR